MLLTTIGTGTAAPEPDRRCSAHLMETGDVRILIDCGPGSVHRMAELGIAWQALTHVALTHFHNDHTGDVPMLFFAWKHGMLPARSLPLTLVGPRGTREKIARMATAFGSHLSEPPFAVTFRECDDGDVLDLGGGCTLSCIRTPHTANSLAYRVRDERASMCCTGDTGYSEDVARFAAGADVLLAECSLPEEHAMDTHLTPTQLARMAAIARPRLLAVTHCYPQLDRNAVPALLRDAGWNGSTHVVRDGDVIDVAAAALR